MGFTPVAPAELSISVVEAKEVVRLTSATQKVLPSIVIIEPCQIFQQFLVRAAMCTLRNNGSFIFLV